MTWVMIYKKQQLVFSCLQKFKLSSRIQKAVWTLDARDGLMDRNCCLLSQEKNGRSTDSYWITVGLKWVLLSGGLLTFNSSNLVLARGGRLPLGMRFFCATGVMRFISQLPKGKTKRLRADFFGVRTCKPSAPQNERRRKENSIGCESKTWICS